MLKYDFDEFVKWMHSDPDGAVIMGRLIKDHQYLLHSLMNRFMEDVSDATERMERERTTAKVLADQCPHICRDFQNVCFDCGTQCD